MGGAEAAQRMSYRGSQVVLTMIHTKKYSLYHIQYVSICVCVSNGFYIPVLGH